MFVSASTQLKFHTYCNDVIDTCLEYKPQAKSNITHVSWCKDNSHLVFLQENQKPLILSTKEKDNIRIIHIINKEDVSALTFKHRTKRNIAIGTKTGDTMLYDTKTRGMSKVFPKAPCIIRFLDFTCDDQHLCVLYDDSLFIHSCQNNNILKIYKQKGQGTTLKCHPININETAIGCNNGNITLWDINACNENFNVKLHSSSITEIAFSTNKNLLVTVGKDFKINAIDLNRNDCNFTINVGKPITAMDLSHDDKIIVGLSDGSIYIYDMKYHIQPLYSTKCHNTAVNKIYFENAMTTSMVDTSIKEYEIIKHFPAVERSKTVVDVSKSESLHTVKKDLMKLVKEEMEDLENQLFINCMQFEKFVNNEFQMINNNIMKKWGIFETGDFN